ncbi:MAG: hypothetical protein ACYC4K_02805 [Thiobacillus sp.]
MYEIVATISATVLAAFIAWVSKQANRRSDEQDKHMEAQDMQIALLFKKHDEDVQKLEDLKQRIAENHPSETKVRSMFSDFKLYLDQRFDRMEDAIKRADK